MLIFVNLSKRCDRLLTYMHRIGHKSWKICLKLCLPHRILSRKETKLLQFLRSSCMLYIAENVSDSPHSLLIVFPVLVAIISQTISDMAVDRDRETRLIHWHWDRVASVKPFPHFNPFSSELLDITPILASPQLYPTHEIHVRAKFVDILRKSIERQLRKVGGRKSKLSQKYNIRRTT